MILRKHVGDNIAIDFKFNDLDSDVNVVPQSLHVKDSVAFFATTDRIIKLDTQERTSPIQISSENIIQFTTSDSASLMVRTFNGKLSFTVFKSDQETLETVTDITLNHQLQVEPVVVRVSMSQMSITSCIHEPNTESAQVFFDQLNLA